MEKRDMYFVMENMCSEYLKYTSECSGFAYEFYSGRLNDALELIFSDEKVDSRKAAAMIKELYEKAEEAQDVVDRTLDCKRQVNQYTELLDQAKKTMPEDGPEKKVYVYASRLCKEMTSLLDSTAVFASEVNETSGELGNLLEEDSIENPDEEFDDNADFFYESSINNMDYYSDKIMEEAEEFQTHVGKLVNMLRSIK